MEYDVSAEIKKFEPVSLNENHTHYILVDNGIRNSFLRSNTINFTSNLAMHLKNGKVVLLRFCYYRSTPILRKRIKRVPRFLLTDISVVRNQ